MSRAGLWYDLTRYASAHLACRRRLRRVPSRHCGWSDAVRLFFGFAMGSLGLDLDLSSLL
jgi:hypothetical protein